MWQMLLPRVLYWIALQGMEHYPCRISTTLLSTVLYQDKAFEVKDILPDHKVQWEQLSAQSCSCAGITHCLIDLLMQSQPLSEKQLMLCRISHRLRRYLFRAGHICDWFSPQPLSRLLVSSSMLRPMTEKINDTPCLWKSLLLTISVMEATFCFWSTSGGMQE